MTIEESFEEIYRLGVQHGIDFTLEHIKEDMKLCIRVALEWGSDHRITEEWVSQIFQESCKRAAARHSKTHDQ